MPTADRGRLDWINISFLTLTPVIGTVGTVLWTLHRGFEWWMLGLFFVLYFLVGMSICAGYHRCFSHRSYTAAKPIQALYGFFGAMAAQNSILWWCSSHRVHHSHVDKDWDPYNIRRGFWWAHILWIFHRVEGNNFENSPDLVANRIVQWQHKYYIPILIFGGFGIPALVGWMFGDPIAGLLWGGFLRIAAVHHSTFFVNSLAHSLGEPRYAWEVSARDNWAVALLTFGEGYHSFHHRFASDYRNGVKWWQWDPAKWLIRGLSKVRLAWDLRSTPAPLIERARMTAALRAHEASETEVPVSVLARYRERIAVASGELEESFELWKVAMNEKAEGVSRQWREKKREAGRRMRVARKEWVAAVRLLRAASQARSESAT